MRWKRCICVWTAEGRKSRCAVRLVLRRRRSRSLPLKAKRKHDACGVLTECMRVYPSGACFASPCHVKMLTLVRAFVGSPSSTFHYLCLPTESLLVSPISPFHSPSPLQLFTALSIRRYSGHPRRHLSSPCPYPGLFSGLSWPGSCERAYHIPCGRSRVEARMYLAPHHNAFSTHSYLSTPRWLPHPVRGLPFGPSPESPPALGLFTHRSFFPMTSTSQLSTVDPVSLPCYYVFFTIAHLSQASWPSRHNQPCLYTL